MYNPDLSLAGNNVPTLDADQYTLDDYPPEGKTYLSAWNLISQNSGASEMNASGTLSCVHLVCRDASELHLR